MLLVIERLSECRPENKKLVGRRGHTQTYLIIINCTLVFLPFTEPERIGLTEMFQF